MDNLVILITIITLTLLSLIYLKKNLNLTAGSDYVNAINGKRELKPVISQTGVSTAAIDQILKPNDLAPGKELSIWPAENLHTYCTPSIEIKPYGFPSSGNLYNDWVNKESSWQVEYSPERLNTDMSRVKFNLEKSTGDLRAVKYDPLINENYYHNPASYCKANFKSFPCPNNNLDNETMLPTGSDNMTFPGLINKKRVLDLQVKDSLNINMKNMRGYI